MIAATLPRGYGGQASPALQGLRASVGLVSLYYIGYASTHMEFMDEGPIWALVAFTIFASTVIHGLTATATVEALDREYAEGDGGRPSCARR